MEAYFKAAAEALAEGLSTADRRDLASRQQRNRVRSAVWAFNAVPWVDELTVDHLEWDVLWRVTFGGVTAEMRRSLDHPDDGFAWRGRRMEYAVVEAIRECAPPGVVAISSQAAPERIPPDHADRCRRSGTSPDGWKRADIALAFITGTTITLDVHNEHTVCVRARRGVRDANLAGQTAASASHGSRWRPAQSRLLGNRRGCACRPTRHRM